ncbi:hypothetical protein QCE49_12520 [Caballeronia sp. LZ008]|uniref:hypothetical protein n=1 Tax=unclassified Caballeronia TaxID=2646786 RepID=UPI0020285346|nr:MULTISPECIES: hypothetical protein [unclassified Caballeronia]MDR5794196.1 hypothetical protein [Caballeronia sp. LZ008]
MKPQASAESKRRGYLVHQHMSELQEDLQTRIATAMALNVPRPCPSALGKVMVPNRNLTFEDFNRLVIRAITHHETEAAKRAHRCRSKRRAAT